MSICIVRLGSPRGPGEGPRIGAVRRPRRGVPKTKCAKQDGFDVWYPNLAPSVERCHRSLLRALLLECGADLKG